MSSKPQEKPGVFAGTGDDLAAGLSALFNQEGEFAFIDLDRILIKPSQVREIFDGKENTIEELTADIARRGVVSPILVREIDHVDFDFELVAGERRCRCSILAKKTIIPAYIKNLTDDEAKEAQVAENIHRLNLTQIETAKQVQRDLDALGGDKKALLVKYSKSASWLSKVLTLLDMPKQTKRLVTENISADMELIGKVRTIEAADPEAARELVDELAASPRQSNAREKVDAIKNKVKPPKKQKPAKEAKPPVSAAPTPPKSSADSIPAAAVSGTGLTASQLADHLQKAFVAAKSGKPSPRLFANNKIRESCEEALKWFYKSGNIPQDAGRGVVEGFKQGIFAVGDHREFFLAAFSYGLNNAEFKPDFIFDSVK
ncbi:MAG: ParB/RepB/Spo0J family partition protein [Halothiobacillaceae bacterium]|nr:ParB/RepB/Spo0J family partition protein [Halothiobacillaceae bacterium]